MISHWIAQTEVAIANVTPAGIDWSAFGTGFMGAIVGAAGTIGTVVFIFGRWQGKTDHRLETIEQRLDTGRDRIDDVPVMQEKMRQVDDAVDRLNDIVDRMDTEMDRYVTQKQCDRRHSES